MSRSLKPAAAYFALVFGAGFILGAIRVPLLVPRLGVRTAELLEMPVMLLAIVFAARTVIRRFALAPSPSARMPVGVLALALLVAAELLLASVLQGQSVQEYVASRDPVSGSVYLGMLLLFALMPQMLAWGENGRMAASLRRAYAMLLLTTVVVGLTIHLHGIGLAAPARDVLGDALWAAMIYWLVSLAAPHGGLPQRATAGLAMCVAVELSQRIEHPVLRAVRSTTLGHLVIGSDFDARDLAAYTVGIAAAVLLDRTAIRSR